MPIYEFYCPEHHTVYQFFAKTLAQGKLVPKCPENPRHRLRKVVSSFAVTRGGKGADEIAPASLGADAAGDANMEAAMGALESEVAGVDENDPRAMGRMMRRMAELSGEKIEGEVEEVVRKLEEGADPERVEEQLGGEKPCSMPDPYEESWGEKKPGQENQGERYRFRVRRAAPIRDPKLYDYE